MEFLEVEAVQNAVLLSESELHARQLKVLTSMCIRNFSAFLVSQQVTFLGSVAFFELLTLHLYHSLSCIYNWIAGPDPLRSWDANSAPSSLLSLWSLALHIMLPNWGIWESYLWSYFYATTQPSVEKETSLTGYGWYWCTSWLLAAWYAWEYHQYCVVLH